MSPQCNHGNMKIDYRCIRGKNRQRDITEGRGTGQERDRVGQTQNSSRAAVHSSDKGVERGHEQVKQANITSD